jgi:peptidoglycan/LPS O-acetylase OafA/YrhL
MKLPYRSEIDGLRTIAVLSVIFYHAQILVFGHDLFKGGFVGVDIFFVISGYLISRILLSELFEKGKISFLHFYERRARRILPILFTVFLVSFPLAYKFSHLLPHQFVEYAQSIVSATFFGSNIFFYFTNTQYGAEDSLIQPFLHTWSLGVEEQFYILFPIVLLLAYKFAKNHLVTIIAVLILISLTYADWQSTKNTQLNFFMLTSRIWELGIGSLLAFYELKYGRVKHELLNQTMPLLGLAMITHAIVFFNNQTPHPSVITLLPTLGTALIILYSAKQTDMVGKVLSWKPIVGVGLISYSMYLWHYPLFAFARIADFNGLQNNEKLWLILLTILLSTISYFFIEKPFRNIQLINIKKFSVVIIILLITILGVNLKAINSNGFEKRLPKLLLKDKAIFTEAIWDKLKIDGKKCYERKDNFCEIGDNKKGVINIVGDSQLASIQSDLIERIQNDYKIISMNDSGCWLIRDTYRFLDEEKNKLDNVCGLDYQNTRIKKIKENPNSIVLLGGRMPLILNEHFHKTDGDVEQNKDNSFYRKWETLNGKSINQAIKDTMLELMNDGHRVILLYPIAEVGWNVPKKLFKDLPKETNKMKAWLDMNRITTSYEIFQKRTQSSFELFNSIRHPNLYRIYPHKLLCDNQITGRCITHDDENIFYADDNHPSNEGAKLINNLIIDKLREIDKTQTGLNYAYKMPTT